MLIFCCDLLENSYLCGISNNFFTSPFSDSLVVICLKIRTFVVSATTWGLTTPTPPLLWFAWKFVPLWYQQQQFFPQTISKHRLWFAWKFVPLWYQQQPRKFNYLTHNCCDLLENSYLCGISNNTLAFAQMSSTVVICLKIRTFVVSATTQFYVELALPLLWFAWKFVPLWYQQQLKLDNFLVSR